MAMAAERSPGHPGEAIVLTLGPETYCPIKYHSFVVGPFSATVVRQPDETTAQAVERGYRLLAELNEVEFNLAWERHKARVAKMPRVRD